MKNRMETHLRELQLPWIGQHYAQAAETALKEHWPYPDYLAHLLEGEAHRRRENRIQRRIQAARFPVVKTLDTYNWSWPKKIDRTQIKDLMRLAFLEDHTNVIFLGGVGVGKTHLATALAHQACLEGHAVLWASTIDMINALIAAQAGMRLKQELKKYLSPRLLVLDELGYLPIDKHGADLLFQVISGRYERGSILLTTNKPFKQWAGIFNNDNTLASAVLDRLLHHAQTVLIDGPSYRMKEQTRTP
jgi:DNA replication protein DnaC